MFASARTFLIVAVIAAVAPLSAPAIADVHRGNGEFGVDVGYTEWDPKLGNNGPRVGFRLGYHLSDFFQVEGQVTASADNDNSIDRRLSTAMGNVLFNFHPRQNLVPYFLVGGGIAYADVDGFGTSVDDTAVAVQFAGGIRFFGPQGKIGLRLETGGMWEDTFNNGGNHWNITGGLTFRLGPAKRPIVQRKPQWRGY